MIQVMQDGSGDYLTITEAVMNARSDSEIHIGPGLYYEKLELSIDQIKLIGSGQNNTIITYDDYAKKAHQDGKAYSTFRTYTMYIGGNDIHIEGMTIENSAGDGRTVGQAIALYVDGDRVSIEACNILGHQDTLFCGPLPESPRIQGSFIGPGQGVTYKQSNQYYHNCCIQGDVDFIFGSALAVFHQCEIVSINRNETINGYVTAASTWEQEDYGLIFYECDFIGEKGIKAETVYLGRPWRPYAKTTFYACRFDQHIHKKHFDPWGKADNKLTSRYREINCDYKDNKKPDNDKTFITIIVDQLQALETHKWHQAMIMEVRNDN